MPNNMKNLSMEGRAGQGKGCMGGVSELREACNTAPVDAMLNGGKGRVTRPCRSLQAVAAVRGEHADQLRLQEMKW